MIKFILSVTLSFNIIASEIKLNSIEKKKILNGDQIVSEEPNPKGFKKGSTYQSIALVEGKVNDIKKVLIDYKSYPEFMPNIKELKVTSIKDGVTIGEYMLSLPLGKYKKYRLKHWNEKTGNSLKIKWSKLPWPELKTSETIVDTSGVWIIEEFPEKKGYSILLYKVYTDPGKIPWGFGWIVDILTGKSIYKVIDSVRKRVKENSNT